MRIDPLGWSQALAGSNDVLRSAFRADGNPQALHLERAAMEAGFYARRLVEHGWPSPELVQERTWAVTAYPIVPATEIGDPLGALRSLGGPFKYNLWDPRPTQLATVPILNQLVHASEFSHTLMESYGRDRVYSFMFASDHHAPKRVYEMRLWELTSMLGEIARSSADRAFTFRWKWDRNYRP
jgi:hypothetical protein